MLLTCTPATEPPGGRPHNVCPHRAFSSMLDMAAAAHIVTGVMQRRPALIRQAASLLDQSQARPVSTGGGCFSTAPYDRSSVAE